MDQKVKTIIQCQRKKKPNQLAANKSPIGSFLQLVFGKKTFT